MVLDSDTGNVAAQNRVTSRNAVDLIIKLE